MAILFGKIQNVWGKLILLRLGWIPGSKYRILSTRFFFKVGISMTAYRKPVTSNFYC